DYDRARNVGILRWKPNPVGRKPVKYRIHGSDEKGFSASDELHKVVVGSSKKVPSARDSNFIVQIAATEAAVIGPEVGLNNATRAYSRGVAVEDQAKRRGPSDYAEAPGPILYSPPVTNAKVGIESRYALSAIRSLGDVRTRVVDGKEKM